MFPINFINAGSQYSTTEKHVPAPYFRRNFELQKEIKSAKILICGLGFCELHVNGQNITKGYLAPYRSNHDHYIYYDEYDIKAYIHMGSNVAAMILGNGMQNAMGGAVWDFQKAAWRSAPQVSFEICLEYIDGEIEKIVSDEQTKTKPSPILFDDLLLGEEYDARLEIAGWDSTTLDDSDWESAIPVQATRGTPRLADVEPLVVRNERKPVAVMAYEDGYIYDFGINTAGLCRMQLEHAEVGQKIWMVHFETMENGKPYLDGIRFPYYEHPDSFQEITYYSAGKEVETYTPHFTYCGFRYVYIKGITAAQATETLLTCLEISSDLKQRGMFHCSDEMTNCLQEATVQTDYSNFYYFPTDCPQREKNGWTCDAANSAEQMLLNLTAEKSLAEWMRNIYKAMNEKGEIPGIVPTGDWGYEWGNGPGWDQVLVTIPYTIFKYRGDQTVLEELALPLMRYLTHLYMSLDEKDLIEIGLGDYNQAKRVACDCETPIVVTDTIMAKAIADAASEIYDILGMNEQKNYAEALKERVRKAFRKHLMEKDTLLIKGDTQTAYAMALYYDMVNQEEKETVIQHLLRTVRNEDEHLGTGCLGTKPLFCALADNGYAELAYHMITREDFPSYGNWIVRGATTLWENFFDEGGLIQSMNHHYFGHISAWFYTYLGGIRFNPTGRDINHVDIAPMFLEKLHFAEAQYEAPAGMIKIRWDRKNDNQIVISITVPEQMHGKIKLLDEYVFESGLESCDLQSGIYIITRKELL